MQVLTYGSVGRINKSLRLWQMATSFDLKTSPLSQMVAARPPILEARREDTRSKHHPIFMCQLLDFYFHVPTLGLTFQSAVDG